MCLEKNVLVMQYKTKHKRRSPEKNYLGVFRPYSDMSKAWSVIVETQKGRNVDQVDAQSWGDGAVCANLQMAMGKRMVSKTEKSGRWGPFKV